jgi:hypothetical protein
MVQARDSPNTERVSFSSAGAVRSRSNLRFVSAQITASHRELIERLQRLPPNETDPLLHADAEELETRAEILRCDALGIFRGISSELLDCAGCRRQGQLPPIRNSPVAQAKHPRPQSCAAAGGRQSCRRPVEPAEISRKDWAVAAICGVRKAEEEASMMPL